MQYIIVIVGLKIKRQNAHSTPENYRRNIYTTSEILVVAMITIFNILMKFTIIK